MIRRTLHHGLTPPTTVIARVTYRPFVSPDIDDGRPAVESGSPDVGGRMLEAVFLVGALVGAWLAAVLLGSSSERRAEAALGGVEGVRGNRVAGHGGWNPTKGCWEFTDVYWERGFPQDLEWKDDDCYVSRVELCLWTEVSCYDREDGELVLRQRSRESDRCYVLAERYCKEALTETWTEDSPDTGTRREEWDVEGEYWREE